MRQAYYSEPWKKHLEAYTNFMGGVNTQTSQDNMVNEELTDLSNVDLGERGSLSRRHGMVSHLAPAIGTGQGYFRFYRSAGSYDEIVAIGGNMYVNGVLDSSFSFQTTKPIEGVQFGDKMYFTTGSRFMSYDGTSFSEVTPHRPNPLEALYIGTNALADDPDNFLQDGVDSVLSIDGVTFSSRYGVMNEPFTLTAYHTAPEGVTVEYQFEYRFPFMEEGKWVLGQDWSSSKQWTFTAEGEGAMQFRINARQTGGTVAEAQYLVPKYTIKPAPDPNDAEPDVSAIHSCNRIILHWNRLIIYGDSNNPDMIYVSHLNNPSYFPVPNTLRFENDHKEAVTCILKYRDSLVVFTPHTIQALYGKSPMDYRRVTLNTDIGCIAPYSAKVVKNHIYFLSWEGIFNLKYVGYSEEKANVERMDDRIMDLVPMDVNACAVFNDDQYQITFPSKGKRLRYYIEFSSWTKDESTRLDFYRTWSFDGEVYGQSSTEGAVRRFDYGVYDDDGTVYDTVIETKYFNFGQPYHKKKLKELQVLASSKDTATEMNLYVYADASITLSPDKSHAQLLPDGTVEWVDQVEPNFKLFGGTTLGSWTMGESPFGVVDSSIKALSIGGKCLRTKVKIVHSEAKPFKLLGFAYIFKIKKP